MTADRASQTTSLGEYAVALNCTITNAMENTIAVRPIMPDAMAVRIASAAPGSMPTVRSERSGVETRQRKADRDGRYGVSQRHPEHAPLSDAASPAFRLTAIGPFSAWGPGRAPGRRLSRRDAPQYHGCASEMSSVPAAGGGVGRDASRRTACCWAPPGAWSSTARTRSKATARPTSRRLSARPTSLHV